MNSSTEKFIKMIKHPVKFRMFLFWKLPAAFFSGVRIKEIDEERCIVTVPYKWLTQNPFRSTYFASLAMAAEMSTGALGMMYTQKRSPAISMLITNMEASYFKKATEKIFFVCEAGKQIHDAIENSISTNKSKSITVKSAGTNKNGDVVAEFLFTWSFKVKVR
jgi:acyl-coenzyme A thioesterase PaaI-like protein